MFGSMGSIWAEMGLDTTKLDMGCAKAAASLKALEGKNSALGSSAKMAAAGIALIGAAVAVAAVKMAADFETSIYNVGAITNASKEQMKDWESSILGMSTKLPVTAKALGDAFYWVKSYMPKASDAEGFAILDTAAKLAVGGISDTTTAVKALAGTMNAYKGSAVALKDSTEYADVMSTAVANGALTMQDLGDNTAKASSTAAIAGVSYRELMAAVVTLTQKGVPAQTTFMALNQAMMAYVKPSEGAKAAAKDLGIDFSLNSLRADGLFKSLMKVADACGTDTSALAEFFPNIRSLKAVLPLAGISADDFAVSMQTMGESAGKTAQMFGTQMEDPAKKFAVALNDAKKPIIELGMNMMPALEKALAKIVTILEGKNSTFNAFGEILKGAAGAGWDFVGVLKSIWPLLLGVGAAFAAFKISNFVTAIASATTGIPMLNNVVANLRLGLTSGMASVGGLATSLGTIALLALPAAIGMGILIKSIQDADQAGNAAAAAIKSMDKANEALGLQLQPLVDRYEALRATQGRSAAQEAELLSVGNQIAQLAPRMASGFDLQGNAIIKSDAQLQQLIKDLLQYSNIVIKGKGAEGQLEGLLGSKAELEKTAATYRQQLNYIQTSINTLSADTSGGTGRTIAGLLEEDFKKGSAAVKSFVASFKDAERLDPTGVEQKYGQWGLTMQQLEASLKTLDGMYTQNGMTLDQVIKKINETDIAMAQLKQQMMQTAAAGGFAEGAKALTDSIIANLQSQTPTLRETGMNQMAAVGQGMLQARGVLGADATTMSQHIANLIASGADWDGTGGRAGQEVYDGLKTRLGASLPGVEAATKAIADGMKVTFTGNPANPIIIEPAVTDPTPTAQGVVSSLNNWFGGNLTHPVVGAPRETGGITAGALAIVAGIQRTFNSNQAHPVIGSPVNVALSPVHSFATPEAAGAYIGGRLSGGIAAGMANAPASISLSGGAMTGGSSLQANITALESAWAALSSTALVGWSKDVDNATAGFSKMEEAILALGGTMAGPQLAAWRNMRAEYDKANAALAEYQKQLDASDLRMNKLTHSQELLNRSLTAQKETLSKLSQMKMAGEGAASDASFAKQHESNRLQLEILKAQKEGRFNDAAKYARDKQKVDKEKELLDLQTTFDYEKQKRGLEKLLDPLKGQEKTYKDLVTQIKAEQKSIASKELALKRIETQINKEKDAQWKLRLEYDACNKAVQTYSAQVDKMAANFLKHFEDMKAAAEALNKTVASSPNKALAIYQAQLTGMARDHKSRYRDMIADATGLNRAVAMGALSGGLGASNVAGSSTTTSNFFFDKLVLNGVQDVPSLKAELMNARLRMATP